MNRLPSIVRQHIAALRMLLAFTVLLGIAYPVVLWGINQGLFPNQANGSTVSFNGKVVGSSLLCQEFVDAKGNPLPQYFQPRPSNAADSSDPHDFGCDAGFSGAANLGPNNPDLVKDIKVLQQQISKFDNVPVSEIPPDAVTTSGSGLDPDISPANAHMQLDRVAAARHLSDATVQSLIDKNTKERDIEFLGEPGVNVLTLNIALDKLTGQHN